MKVLALKNRTWLIGAGGMAIDYIKVLQALGEGFTLIGRGEQSAKSCHDATGCEVVVGGVLGYLARKPTICTHAIVAVGAERLHETTMQLLDYGVRNILVEKPAGLNKKEIENIYLLAKETGAKVCVAYNRRFFASVLKAKEIIDEDGGVSSFNFEFTEWSHVIEKLRKAEGVKEKWFLGNSTHVVDLAFYLGGEPKDICSFTAGTLPWHPAASIFAGAGISGNGALFNYQANWESAGRWSVEVLTKNRRLILRPLEKLQIQKKGSVATEFAECDYALDEAFKPGLFVQTKNFLNNTDGGMCGIEYHFGMIGTYNKIAGYGN